MYFNNKTVFITGGASGIGKQTALRFAELGANIVIVTRRSIEAAENTVREIEKIGARAIYLQCDVGSDSDVRNAVKTALDTFGSIDIAFNNAGIGPDNVTIPLAPLSEVTEQDWDNIINSNLKGTFLCMKYQLRAMREAGSGLIINVASTAGLKPIPKFGAYAPSKAGIIMMSKMAAMENLDKDIRVNVVCPGPTLGTGMADRMFKDSPERSSKGPRMGTTDDIADVVIWLSSAQGSRINGCVIPVDGGIDII